MNETKGKDIPEKNSKYKSIYHEIAVIGVPSFLETLFMTFAAVIDSKMVASMGVVAISAVSVTNQPRLFIFSIFFAMNTVTSSLTAKYYGMDNRDEANKVFDHMLKATLGLSIVLSILAVVFAGPIMQVFSGQEDTMADSIVYFRIIIGGMTFNLLYMVINAALRGFGKTTLTFTSNVLSSLVHLFFNYLLIDGHWGFPALGIAGAAIATVLGTVAAFLLCLFYVLRPSMYVNIPYCIKSKYHISREGMDEILNLTKSCAADNISMRATLLVISGITARIGSFQMAVYAVGLHLLNVNAALGTGLQTSAVALVGRSYGAEDQDKLQEFKNALIKLGIINGLAVGGLIILSAKWFYGFFSDDPEFIALGASSCVLIGIVTLPQTLKFVFNGCLQGVGAMKEVMIASIFAFSLINLASVALVVLVLHLGVRGVWFSTIAAQTTQAVLLYYFIRKNDVLTPKSRGENIDAGKSAQA